MNTRVAAAYAALFLLVAFGLFSRLDDRLLWGDEAETAVLAVNITRFGVPQTDDGRNVIANLADRGDSNDDGIWTWSPWLDEYLTAGSFLVFGRSTLTARLPFALIALAAALLLVRVSLRCTGRHEVALLALALYATCVPLLLHARQARYYAVLALAELWLMHGLSRLLGSARRRGQEVPREDREDRPKDRQEVQPAVSGALHITLALAVLFYCNYIVVPANGIALAVVGISVWRRSGRFPVALAVAALAFAGLAAPWLVYAPPTGQLGSLGFGHFVDSLTYYVCEIHFHLVPWVVLALPGIALLLRRPVRAPLPGELARPTRPTRSSGVASLQGSPDVERFVWFLLAASLLVYSLSPLRFFRYLIPLAPPLIFLSAVLLTRHVRIPSARLALVVVLASSNAIAIATAPFGSHAFEAPYANFARSITREHSERLDDVLEFLEERAEADQTVWVSDPEFPLMFYTELAIIDARYHRFPEDPPDWVFGTSASGLAHRRPLELPAGVRTLYRSVPLEVRRSPRAGNLPNPHTHAWFEALETDSERMPIYQKR